MEVIWCRTVLNWIHCTEFNWILSEIVSFSSAQMPCSTCTCLSDLTQSSPSCPSWFTPFPAESQGNNSIRPFFSYILFSNQVLLQSGNHHPWRLFFFRFLFSFGLHIGFSFSESLELSSLWQSPTAVDCAVEVDTGGGGDSTVTCLDVSSCGGVKTTWIGLLNKANSYCSVIHLQDWYW